MASVELPARQLSTLFFFDVLGFADRVEALGLDRIYELYEGLVSLVRAANEPGAAFTWIPLEEPGRWAPVGLTLDTRATYFSDTILLWGSYAPVPFQATLDLAIDLFCDCLRGGLPLRGAVAVGEVIMDPDRGIYLGAPIIEAARAEQAQRWCGFSLCPSFNQFPHIGPADRILDFTEHIKPGYEDVVLGIGVDWTKRWRDIWVDEPLGEVLDRYRRPGFDAYWDMTARYAEESQLDDRGSLPSGRERTMRRRV